MTPEDVMIAFKSNDALVFPSLLLYTLVCFGITSCHKKFQYRHSLVKRCKSKPLCRFINIETDDFGAGHIAGLAVTAVMSCAAS